MRHTQNKHVHITHLIHPLAPKHVQHALMQVHNGVIGALVLVHRRVVMDADEKEGSEL
jgi:hypothetical protein